MKAAEVRQSYIDFFAERGHKAVPSAPVVPQDDPTLLFTNAGMNQFKDVFLETGTRPYKRAVDSQKCIRVSGKHNDLEEVGHDTYHHTFFEMMGNWSFGDYYKKEAIEWAWDLVTRIWGLPKKRLYATVFREDNEAEEWWKKVTNIDHSHIFRFDEKDNFWEMGEVGPCGPCSEIHIDLGEAACDHKEEKGHVCGVNGGCARYIELWNLVFIQYNRDASGKTVTLPARHVDTGLGLERAVAVLQGTGSNYQTDLFLPIMEHLSDLTEKPVTDASLLPAFRVIADHVRALTTAITDGALPSNEGRGYVLRRILRRAARYGRNLEMHEPFIYKLVPTVSDILGGAYPEIAERIEHTTHVIRSEEERFNEVLDRGMEIFEQIIRAAKKRGNTVIPGTEAFKLYDTYGFPLDLTQLMARERNLAVDEKSFQQELEAQRERAREAAGFGKGEKAEWTVLSEGAHSEFLGYGSCFSDCTIRRYRPSDQRVEVVLDRTPFYAESGGQVGDRGSINGDGFTIEVEDTFKEGDFIIHIGRFIEGDRISGPAVTVQVDEDRRKSTARNHTSTHLLHKALKERLGDHVNQAGSLVSPERLRFDFTHFAALNREDLDWIEKRVNRQVRSDMKLNIYETSLKEAKAKGVTALFGEKYDETVRVVAIDDYSMELCGGTHLESTGEIGYFRIVREESVAAGVRRIEAVTGIEADRQIREEKHLLARLEDLLACRREELAERLSAVLAENKELSKSLAKVKMESAGSEAVDLLDSFKKAEGIPYLATRVEAADVNELRALGDKLREKLSSGVAVLATHWGNKVQFLCVVSDDLIREKGLKAGDIVREVARKADGSGGGRPQFALAGAKSPDKIDTALAAVPEIITSLL